MKKLNLLLFISSISLLLGCNKQSKSSGSVLSNTSSYSNEVSSNTSSSVSSFKSSTSEVKYASWPSVSVQNLCKRLDPDSNEVIPSYDYASKIAIDTESLLEDGYFGVYCHVDSIESEQIYINKLKENNWKVSNEKVEGFFEAYSPLNSLWLNFAYDDSYEDLEIYVSKAPILSWPEELINKKINLIVPKTATTIPSFEAELYTVNYYPSYATLAINGYGVSEDILETYKTKITSLNWEVSIGNSNDEYQAISPLKDLLITFYYDENKNEFNIDVQKKLEDSSSWPSSTIASLVSEMGLTGEVMEYTGNYSKVVVDNGRYPAIIVYVEKGTEAINANSYNQMLLANGYVVAGTIWGEEVYNKPGTTLVYRATNLTSDCFTIELFDIASSN